LSHNVLVSKIRCNNPNRKNAAIHNRNHFIYIGTREGTDLTPLKYEDTEKFEKEMSSSEDYVRYIAKRPHSHGLFGNVPLEDINEFSKEIYSISMKKRNIYRGIVSLDAKDAEELGYYDKSKWESYIRSVIPDVAKEFGISIEKLQWAAAYHAEAGHPHAHYMFWSSERKINSSFIHPSKQNTCREILSRKMFEEEHSKEAINKTIFRDYIIEFGKELMSDEIAKVSAMTSGLIHNTAITHRITLPQLDKTTEELLNLIPLISKNGSTKYKLVPPKVKDQVNKVVDSILVNKSVNEAYEKYLNSTEKVDLIYSPSKEKQKHAASKDNAIKDIRKRLCNIVLTNIKNELKAHSDYSSYITSLLDQYEKQRDHDHLIEQFAENPMYDNSILENSNLTEFLEDNNQIEFDSFANSFPYKELVVNDDLTSEDETNSNTYSSAIINNVPNNIKEKFYIKWDKPYKTALNELYNTHDYEKAIELLNKSASKGNVLAIHDLGKICHRGLGCFANEKLAESYFSKAFQGFNTLYKIEEKLSMKEYLAYRIGKLYNTGHGAEENIDMAEKWFITAGDNKYAQYSLAKIYMDKDIKNGKPSHSHEIINLLESSSDKSAYASYELGNIYRKGFFTDIDSEKSYDHYNAAINKFNQMLKSSTDDTLMYRVGKMYELELGTDVDLTKATKLFQEAGKLKNRYALYSLAKIYLSSDDSKLHEKSIQILNDLYKEKPDDDMVLYSLGKIYLDTKTDFYDINKAKEYLEKSSKTGNQFAQYQLGKIYSSPDFGEPDYPLAISYLEASAAQRNDFALYQLAVLYKNSDLDFYDIDKAIDYFKSSAELGNQFAQYQLGKIYSSSDFDEPNYPLAISYLEASAAQGNDFALYQLGRIYSNEDISFYNMDQAISYLMESSSKNNSFAQLQLGIIYLWGKGTKRDVPLGKDFIDLAIKNGNPFAQQVLDSYETYRLQYAMNISYKLFTNIYEAITNQNDRASTIAAERHFRNLSKKAMIEEQLKNPHKHSYSYESEK
jgi:TPR repeat protein